MQEIKKIINNVMLLGTSRNTRAGVTTSKFFETVSFNLQDGFPAVTCKQLAFKSMMGELLLFCGGVADRRLMSENFNDSNWDIWKQDCERKSKEDPSRFNGYNMGEMYPEMWRMRRISPSGTIELKPRTDLDSNETVKGIPSVCGFGINDYPDGRRENPKIYRIWMDMIIRCYGSRPHHKKYRENGCSVSPRWQSFRNFYNDVFSISGFQSWVDDSGNFSLDKDYFGSNVYSRNTCIFLESNINRKLNGGGQGLRIFKVGDDILFGLQELADRFDTYRQHDLVGRLLKSGCDFIEIYDSVDVIYRPKIFVDQLQDAIDKLINDPTGRYALIDNWNIDYKKKAVLGACHNMLQFYVRDAGGKKYLDMAWHQRSVDVFLGLPFNIASYAALVHILAQICGYEVGMLHGTLGDVHIYEQHVDGCTEYLSRDCLELPQLFIMPDVNSLSDLEKLTAKDFSLVNYKHHGKIAGKLSVGN